MSERKIGFDRATLGDKIAEETDEYLVMPAVIARELVQPYRQGIAFKPAEELEKAAWTAEGRWVATMKHPDTGLITRRSDVKGRVEGVEFAKDIMDPKTKRPMIRGIRANIKWFKDRVPKEVLDDVKSGALKDVSIGFTYEEDKTPGEWEGEKYDFVQRNIFVDHVVAPCPVGRCPSPYCGIGVDSILKDEKVGGDPWEETEEYIRSGHREPSEKCKTMTISEDKGIKAILCKYGEAWEIQSYLFEKEKWTMERAKAWFKEHENDKEGRDLGVKCEVCDEIKRLGELEFSTRLVSKFGKDAVLGAVKDQGPRSEEERAKAHFNISDEEWKKLSEKEKQAYIDKLPPRGSGDEEGAREKAKKEQEARASKYGITIKEGGNVTKPGEFSNIPDDEFADPVNYRYPIDAAHVQAAWAYISQPDNKEAGGYSSEEWGKMQEKVKAAMKKHGQVEGEPPVKKDEGTPPGEKPDDQTPPPKDLPSVEELIAKGDELMAIRKRLNEKSAIFA